MEKNEQERIINELFEGLKESMLQRLPRVPENWDGFELRQWVSDYVNDNVNYRPITGKRLKEYKNDCIIHNLI